MKENPEFRHAMPMSSGPLRRFVDFDPKKHTDDMRDKQCPGSVEVFSHIYTGDAWIPNPEYATAPYEEKLILTIRTK